LFDPVRRFLFIRKLQNNALAMFDGVHLARI